MICATSWKIKYIDIKLLTDDADTDLINEVL